MESSKFTWLSSDMLVDAGKSTMMGHLLFDLGNIPQRVMHKYEQESKKIGKQSVGENYILVLPSFDDFSAVHVRLGA